MNTRKKDDYPDSRCVKERDDEYQNECRHCMSHAGELDVDPCSMRKVIALVLTILEIESWENTVDN
jgi:hypothetical protein